MQARTFAAAVAPAIGAETLVGVGYLLFSPLLDWGGSDISVIEWTLGAASFLAFPLWAGVRVARVGGKLRWCGLGVMAVLLGALVAGTFAELFDATPFGSAYLSGLLVILGASPFVASVAIVGGVPQRFWVRHGA